MKKIALQKAEREEVTGAIQRYFLKELDHEIGALEAEMLLQFFAESVGPFYYNQGLSDAQAVFAKSIDDINERIYGLEQRGGVGSEQVTGR